MKNKFDTRLYKLAALAMLSALSIVLVALIRIPMFRPFLEYDPADIPILIGGILFGPAAGLMMTVIVSAIQAMTLSAESGWIGFVMHTVATGGMVIAVSLLFRSTRFIKRKLLRLALALGIGGLVMTAIMVPMNLLLTPLYTQMSAREIWNTMLFTVFVPFNLVKAAINCSVAFLVYPPIYEYVKKRDQDRIIY